MSGIRIVLLVCSALLVAAAGCYYEEDIRNSPEYTLAKMKHDLADSQASSLSQGLAFFREGASLANAEQAYRDCLVQAQMATASIPDVITRRLREHELIVNAMKAKGFFQVRRGALPTGAETVMIDGVTIAGSAGNVPERLAFWRDGEMISQAERDYRQCLLHAQIEAGTIADTSERRTQQVALTVAAMEQRGYQQIPVSTVPPGCVQRMFDGVAVAGLPDETGR
jgi:hypothetical protein